MRVGWRAPYFLLTFWPAKAQQMELFSMTFINSIILLAAIGCGVFVPMVIGHFLAVHEPGKAFYALGFAVASAVLMMIHNRLAPKSPPAEHQSHN
jgi:hypothetical protein